MDRTSGEFRLRDGKRGPRMVPLTTPVLKVLDGIERVEGNPWVIRSKKPGACLPDLTYYWNRIQVHAGLDGVRVHDLRHSCASWPDFLAAKEVIKRCNWLSFSLLPKPPDIAIYNPKSHSHRIHSNI